MKNFHNRNYHSNNKIIALVIFILLLLLLNLFFIGSHENNGIFWSVLLISILWTLCGKRLERQGISNRVTKTVFSDSSTVTRISFFLLASYFGISLIEYFCVKLGVIAFVRYCLSDKLTMLSVLVISISVYIQHFYLGPSILPAISVLMMNDGLLEPPTEAKGPPKRLEWLEQPPIMQKLNARVYNTSSPDSVHYANFSTETSHLLDSPAQEVIRQSILSKLQRNPVLGVEKIYRFTFNEVGFMHKIMSNSSGLVNCGGIVSSGPFTTGGEAALTLTADTSPNSSFYMEFDRKSYDYVHNQR